jgi:hypothetical protein
MGCYQLESRPVLDSSAMSGENVIDCKGIGLVDGHLRAARFQRPFNGFGTCVSEL